MARPRRGCLAEACRWSSDRGGGDRAVPSVERILKEIETARGGCGPQTGRRSGERAPWPCARTPSTDTFLGALIYLIAQSDGMAQRRAQDAHGQRAQMDDYVRSVAGKGGPAGEIDRAKQLLGSGAITQTEYEAIKAKALA
jgi:hypothetical protein